MKPILQDSILLTTYDLKRLFIRSFPQLKKMAILVFCFSFLFLVLGKPKYLAKASFKHLDKQNDFSPFAKEIFRELSLPSANSPIFSVMHSNNVLKKAVEELGMNVIADPFFMQPFKILQRMLDNIKSECGFKPNDPDTFCFRNVTFEEEKPLAFYVKPLSSQNYQILNREKKLVAQGKLGKVLQLPQGSFSLYSFAKKSVIGQLYPFKIIPWIVAVDDVKKLFEIRSHKLDKNVFTLYFEHANRHFAAQFLNQVMQSYQEYYRKENEEICETQVAYLKKRQDELIAQFDSALKEHVDYLKHNIAQTGSIGFSNELDLLAAPQNLFNSKLFDVDLELKRLESLYTNPLLASKDALPSLDRKLRKTPLKAIDFKQELQQTLMNQDLEKQRLLQGESLQEQDTLDCDALTLQSAKTLYLQYTEKKDVSEAQLRERIFLRDRINDPDFELSSLSTFLTDSVSLGLTQHATDIALKIKDGENRTAREQERLKEELDTQKRFLHQHLTHMIELEKLQLKLLSRKIDSLQLQTLNLLDTEKHLLKDKLTELNTKMSSLPENWRRENLLLLKKELGSRIIGSMTQLVETKNLNQKLFQVASKHLDLSIPPLKAQRPHLILFSLLAACLGCFTSYMYKLCALLLKGFPVSHVNLKYGGFSTYGVLSSKCSCGIEELDETDLSTLRGLVYFIGSLDHARCITLLTGNNPDWSSSLADLLSLSGKKILLIHYLFNQTTTHTGHGLFSYLQEEVGDIPLRHHARYDEIPSGKSGRHSPDMLRHPRFLTLINAFKEKYDYILLQSDASVNRREAEGFSRISDAVIVAAREESQEDLHFFRDWSKRKEEPCLAFVCFD